MADAEADGERLDRFLTRRLPDASRVEVQAWIRAGEVSVAGSACRRPAVRLRAGQDIALAQVRSAPRPALQPLPLPLEILYADADIAVVSKPAGLVVHPAASASGPTLVHALLHHLGAANLSRVGAPNRPGIVHRLDRDTSGLLLVAKTDAAHHALVAQFQARTVRKRYLGLVHGAVAAASGRVDAPVARDLRRRERMTTRRAAGREAHTLYQVRERLALDPGLNPGAQPQRFTFLELDILTGRTHQIRVHMASIGHPIVGDRLYGAPARISAAGPLTGLVLKRLFLHAAELAFVHPRTSEEMVFRADLPGDLAAWLERLRVQARVVREVTEPAPHTPPRPPLSAGQRAYNKG